MKKKSLWLGVILTGWLAVDCTNDNDSGGHIETDSGSEAKTDSGSHAILETIDQTPSVGANGLAFDAKDMIWLADLFGNQVLRIDPANGEILARFVHDEAGPDDIAIDQQGRVFWTGWFNGQIGRIDPETGEEVIVAQLPEGANPIAFSNQGRLFVGMEILNQGLYEVDPEGIMAPRLITNAVGNLNGFEFGPNGFLWAPLDGAVVKIDVETGEVVQTVTEGSYYAVKYNKSDNSLYALTSGEDLNSPALDRIDFNDFSISTFSAPDLRFPDNFAFHSNGDIYVTGFDAPELVVISPDGTTTKVITIGEQSEKIDE